MAIFPNFPPAPTQLPSQGTGIPGIGMGAYQPDPVQAKIQAAIDGGQINNSERAYLDRVSLDNLQFQNKVMLSGHSVADSKAIAQRKSQYEQLANRFIGNDLAPSLTSEGDAAQVSTYDRQTISRQQQKLLGGVGDNSINRREFHELTQHSLRTEELRAQMRAGGYTAKEREVVEARLKQYDRMLTRFGKENTPEQGWKPQSGATGTAIDQVFQQTSKNGSSFGGFGMMNPNSSGNADFDKLHQRAYGSGVLARGGKVYDDERADVRAAVNRPTQKVEDFKPGPINEARINRLHAMFPALDKDKDGKLTEGEVFAAVRDPKWKGEDAKLLAATLQSFEQIAEKPAGSSPGGMGMFPGLLGSVQSSDPGTISAQSLVRSGKNDSGFGNRAATLSENFDYLKDKATGPNSLYGGKNGPEISSLHQGSEGDCWLLSSMAAMSPDKIKHMIHERKDGKYELRLPGRKPEIVDAPTEAERNFYATSNGVWANVIEKGVGQIMERERDADPASKIHPGRVLRGGVETKAMEILTGVPGAVVAFNQGTHLQGPTFPGMPNMFGAQPAADGPPAIDGRDPERVGRILTKAFAEGRPVAAASSQGMNDQQHSPLSASNHAYSVVGYDPAKKLVTIRNPWGAHEKADNDGKDDGKFTMTLKEFQATFNDMTVGRTRPDQPIF